MDINRLPEYLRQATAAYRQGRWQETLQICRQILLQRPDQEAALSLLGAAQNSARRFAEAAETYRRLTVLRPEIAEHWSNLGTVLRAQGDLDGALTSYRAADRLGLRSPDHFLNLGLLHIDRGEIAEALPVLQWGAAIAPADYDLRYHYAWCCHEAARDEDGLNALRDWLQWDLRDAAFLARLGGLLMLLGETDGAERALLHALRVQPREPRVLIEYATFLERTNRVEQARALIADVPADLADDLEERRLVLAARLAERSGDLARARHGYERYAIALGLGHRQHHALFPLAKVLDAQGRYEEAFETIGRAHAAQMQAVGAVAPKVADSAYRPLRITEFGCEAVDVARWRRSAAPSIQDSPVFVVAFPRSGTTLLEQMLDALPALTAMDEQPFLQNAIDRIVAMGVRYPEELSSLNEGQCDEVRSLYWKRVATCVQLRPGQRLVDKNPLNLLRLPAICRLFPNAPIVLAIRHPCDVILSNYFQHFRAPEVAAMCRDLQTLSGAYRRAFDFWYRQAELLAPMSLELRYEDLVTDVEAQARRLVQHIGVEWHDAMLRPAENARRRGFISTPSYSQVVQPINQRGVGRWLHYRRHFDQVLPIVDPYLKRWAYNEKAQNK